MVGGQRHSSAVLPPGKTRYPLYRRLGGPQGRSGLVRKIFTPPGLDPRTVQPAASRYTDWAIPPPSHTYICMYIYIYIYICSVVSYTVSIKPEVDLLCLSVFTGNLFVLILSSFNNLKFRFLTEISTKDIYWRAKDGRCLGLTTLPP